MRKQFDNEKRLTGHDNDALYFRDDRSSCSSSTENIRLGPFIEFNELEKEFPRVSSQVPLSPRGDEDDRSYQFSEAEAERGTWTGKFDFLLSLLGYSVGLGNVWRFPYLCYRNGGGAFLIPFISMMLLAGLPLMFMELSFGQYASLGPIAIFDRFCPLFAGLGYGMVIVSGTVMLYYNMIIAWTIFYMFASWNSKLPWEHCDPEWSTPDKKKLSANDQDVKQSEPLNGKQLNAIQSEASSAKKLTGWFYPVENNPLIPAEASNPEPYDFGYGINDGLGSTQFRRESTKGEGTVTGNYGYKDYQGVFRYVNYVADKDGFRAVVRSNEPSVLPVDSADATFIVDPPPPFSIPSKS